MSHANDDEYDWNEANGNDYVIQDLPTLRPRVLSDIEEGVQKEGAVLRQSMTREEACLPATKLPPSTLPSRPSDSSLQQATHLRSRTSDPNLLERSHHASVEDIVENRDDWPLPPRMVVRNLPFHQSDNAFAVQHTSDLAQRLCLLRHDWFHVILNLKVHHSLLMLLSSWMLINIVFAGIYMRFDRLNGQDVCGMGVNATQPIAFGAAVAFSVETCTTVGYGLPSGSNAFFEKCPVLQFFVFWQMVWSMLFNAFLFAFFFLRLSKSDSRGVQVVFSKKAIMSIVSNQVRFQVRVYDMDAAHPVVEAHVRMYVLMRTRPVPRPLRILQPNDELGACLFMSLPTVVSHHVDVYSWLHPPTAQASRHQPVYSHGLTLRQADGMTGSRDNCICNVCGESYGTHDRWVAHVKYQQMVETKEKYPIEGSHQSIPPEALEPPVEFTIPQLRDYFQRDIAEVVVVVEGIDPPTSGTFQALQSYRYEDIVWNENAQFQSCLQEHTAHHLHVDLTRFHGTLVRDENMTTSNRVRRRKRSRQRSSRDQDGVFFRKNSQGKWPFR